jgi:hypothetical protein
MKNTGRLAASILASTVLLMVLSPAAQAVLITDEYMEPTSDTNAVQSGNGQLDLIIVGYSGGGGVTENAAGGFDGDDANTQMPNGSSVTTVDASYATSIGELRDFYELNFPDVVNNPNLIPELVLFVDLSETGQVNDIKLDDLKIVLNYDDFAGGTSNPLNTPATSDVSSAEQNSIGSSWSGGTVIAELDPTVSPKSLALNDQGSGFADWFIRTGFNPFDDMYSEDDSVLFYWNSHDHDDGGDKVFLSGSYFVAVPEPASMAVLAVGGLIAGFRRRSAR